MSGWKAPGIWRAISKRRWTRRECSMSLTDVHIRRAEPADADSLKAILRDTFESTWLPQLTVEAAAAIRREDRPGAYVGERGMEFWVAERGGEVVGLVDWQDDFVNALHVL